MRRVWTIGGVVILGGLGCLPPESPEWLLTRTIALGIRSEVVTPGPYSEGLNVPPGGTRADALPLDTFELTLATASPEEPKVVAPIWLACPLGGGDGGCLYFLEETPADCADPLPLWRSAACRLGVAPRVHVTLEDFADALVSPLLVDQRFAAVASLDDALAPEDCVERLLARPREGLEDCLLVEHRVLLGPLWHLWPYIPAGALFPLAPSDLPEALREELANVHPMATVLVLRSDGWSSEAGDGSRITVAAGQRISVLVTQEEGSKQEYSVAQFSGDALEILASVSERTERIWVDAYATTTLEQFTSGDRGAFFTVPPGAPPFWLYLWVADERGGSRPITLEFVGEEP